MKKSVVSILGCGWLGLPLLRALVSSGKHIVRGSSRDPETLSAITAAGAEAFRINLPEDDLPTGFLADCRWLIWTLPPRGRALGEAAAGQYVDCLSKVSAWLSTPHRKQRFLLLSSTGVYGNATGATDEAADKVATTASARAMLEAETYLRQHARAQVDVLYLAGLVGPGRHPGRFFGGRDRPIPQADAPVNLVHQDDVIAAIRLVMAQDAPGSYNVCAAAHPPKGSYYKAAAERLGLAVAGTSPGGGDGKVITSDKLRSLGWTPRWDNLDLAAL